jgi:hypothetical protein
MEAQIQSTGGLEPGGWPWYHYELGNAAMAGRLSLRLRLLVASAALSESLSIFPSAPSVLDEWYVSCTCAVRDSSQGDSLSLLGN